MSSKKVFYIMIGTLSLLGILLTASVVVGDRFLSRQSNRLNDLKLENEVIEAQQASLVQAKKDLQKYAELQSIAKQIVPQDKDQARATREIISIAEQSNVRISSITFPSSNLGQPQTKAPVTPEGGTPNPAASAPPVSQVKAVDGIKGLYQLDITVVSDATSPANYARLINFLSRLEQNRRTAQVSQISIQPDPLNRSGLNFTLTITVYIKP